MKEKSPQEKNAAERQVSLITEALSKAADNKGVWLNEQGKQYPRFYPKGAAVSPFNALVMGLNSDKNGFSTNLYTLFSEAKKRDESVMAHERGVPFNWYAWNKYVNRHNPEDIISRKDYQELSATDQTQYKGIHNREIRVLFNIDQTMLLLKDKEKYEEVVKANVGANEDKALRSQVNDFIQKMKDNLMAVRKDGSGVAHYDTEKDAVYMPKQENFEQYSDYVQEMLRQVVSATGHQQRLAREGMVMKNGIAPSEDAVSQSKQVGFDRIQMVQDDNKRWAMYIKPEGQKAFSIYPDKADLNRFFTTLKQAQDTMDCLRVELAQKYYAMAETKPDLKVDLFGSGQHNEVDMNRIQKVNVFKAKNDVILCAATIDGADKLQPRVVSPSQWQRMWIAEDKNEYKKHLAATLFADILQKGQTQEQTASEKQGEETEVKQETQVSTDKNEEEHREYHEEENKQASSEEKTDIREEKDATVQRDNNATVEKKEETKGKQKEETKDSPIMKQWKELKAKHPDALLLFRVGDFYEMYEQDAKRGAEVLGITLTKRNTQAGPYMAGFPHHALDTYLPKLIRAGERVAICDQLEAPKQKQEEQNTEEQQRSGGMKR